MQQYYPEEFFHQHIESTATDDKENESMSLPLNKRKSSNSDNRQPLSEITPVLEEKKSQGKKVMIMNHNMNSHVKKIR